jgi:hypothetical protein
MTAFRFLRRPPAHNARDGVRVHRAPSHINDVGSAGGPFRQTVRAIIPGTPKPYSR